MNKNKTPIIIFLLVCQFINLLDFSFFFECVLLLFLLLINRTLKTSALGLVGIICCCWSIVIMILDTDQPTGLTLETGFSAICAYLIGFNCMDKSTDISKTHENSVRFTVIPIVSMAVYQVLNCLARSVYETDTGEGFSALYQQLIHRNSYSIWDGTWVHPTAAQQYLVGIMCLMPFIISYFTGKKRMFLLAVYAIALACSFDLGSRTGVYIAIIVIALFVIQSMFKRNVTKSKLFRFFAVAAVGVILFIVYNEQIIEYVTNTTIAQRVLHSNSGISGALDDNSRLEVYAYLFENMLKYPFGGIPAYFGGNTSAHNQFLNFYQLGGFVPFVTYFIFYFGIVYRAFKVWRFYNDQKMNAKFIFYIMMGMFLIFMFEAPYLSNPIFNSFSMFFFGLIDSIYLEIIIVQNGKLELNKNDMIKIKSKA